MSLRQKPQPAATANPAVFQAYQELALAKGIAERVEVLERLYRAGWKDAIDHLERAAWTSAPHAGGDPHEELW